MEEFIRDNFFLINEGVIVIAAVIGLFCLKKFYHSHTRFFIYFLVYVVFVELIGYYPSLLTKNESLIWLKQLTINTIIEQNYLWYAIFWQLGSAIFLSFYFLKILENDNFKKVITYGLICYVLFSIVYSIANYEVFYNDSLKLIWILSVCQIVLIITLYFLEVLGGDKIISFYKSFEFYVAAVFFIWFLIRTPLSFYQIYYSQADWNFVFLRRDITLFSNVFMYLTFTFALIFCKPNYDK